MHLYLVRHGQSEGNVVTYDLPDGNLTAVGRLQAEETARHLQGAGIELIITSPLRRAVQTGDALRQLTGVPLEVWRDLSEHRTETPARFLGRAGVQELCPGALCDEDLPEDGFELGLETRESTHDRAVRMIERLRNRFAETDKKVALFAHGAFNSFMMMVLFGRPVGPGFWIDQNNCAINRFRIEPKHVRLISVNETAHLTQIT